MAEISIRIIISDRTAEGLPEVDRFRLVEDGEYLIGRSRDCDIRLDGSTVSGEHALLSKSGVRVQVTDVGSTNGTYISGNEVSSRQWRAGEELEIGPFILTFERTGAKRSSAPDRFSGAPHTIVWKDGNAPQPSFPGDLFKDRAVSAGRIAGDARFAGHCNYLAIGSGIGSFCWVDHLRVFGVPSSQIKVVGVNSTPYSKYKLLCRNSQIPDAERLRSNSISTPDNIWGFPGYASRETWRELKQGKLSGLDHIFAVFGEPTLKDSYTPRAGDVYRSMDVEAHRIGWPEMLVPGRVVAIRKTDDGRYVVAYRLRVDDAGSGNRERFIIGRFLHLSTGYPASRYLPDLQKFRDKYPGVANVVNAYAEHGGIYKDLASRGGTVIVRGRGIVASRVIQKLHDTRRDTGSDIRIYQLMRSKIDRNDGARYDLSQRPVSNDVEIQPFNWPKSAWGGSLRKLLENSDPRTRARLLRNWGGTTTADRHDWETIQVVGKQQGWLKPYYGAVTGMRLKDGQVICDIKATAPVNEKVEIAADYIVDCTGLIGDLPRSPLMRDLLETYHLERNPIAGGGPDSNLAGLAVTNSFEVAGLRNGQGRAYAAGVLTTNGPYAGVDSFLGLQYATLRSVDHLRSVRAPGISRFGAGRSFSQWLKWCRGVAP